MIECNAGGWCDQKPGPSKVFIALVSSATILYLLNNDFNILNIDYKFITGELNITLIMETIRKMS